MTGGDLPACLALADLLFPDHPEDPACFTERLGLSPSTCLVLDGSGGIRGYAIAYPWRRGALPPLNGMLGALPGQPDVLYIHDLAVHPDLAGRGLARAALALLRERASSTGLTAMALVAVNHSQAFWTERGFSLQPADPAKLATYGADARYMALPV